MKPTRCLALLAFPSLLMASPQLALAQAIAPQHEDVRAEVPALVEFHEVIRTLWHDAWPNKDYAALRALAPEIRERSEAVVKAELPGILRDKQAAWAEGVNELEAVVATYTAAAEGTDDQKLLDAGEQLHAQFEKLVGIIRPALKELGDFHVVLYRLYHHDLPSNDLAAMRSSVDKLKEPMAALNAASLPERLGAKQKEFDAARKKLFTGPAGSTRKHRGLAMPSVLYLGSDSAYMDAYRLALIPGRFPLAATGKMFCSAVSHRALFHRFGSHTPPGCPGPADPLPPVPTAPLSAM